MNKIKINCAYTELVDISQLKENPSNPKIIKIKKLEVLKKELINLGFFRPIIVDKSYMIIGGHQRLKALQMLVSEGYDCSKIPISIYTDEEKKRYVQVADNIESGEWNKDPSKGSTLNDHLNDMRLTLDDFDLELTGLVDEDLKSLEVDLDPQVIPSHDGDLDNIPDTSNKNTVTKRGDIWELDGHKILSGDATMIDDINKLMGDEKIDCLMTDPPYGVDYASKNEFLNKFDKGNHIQTDIKNDAIENYREWFASFLALIPFADYNTFYIWMSGQELHNLRLAIEDCDCKWGDYLVWVKNNHVLGRKDYNSKHEFCVYGWKGKHKFYGDFSTTILNYNKPLKNDLHPTMKPVDMLAKLINDGSPKKGIVLDVFGGSGSTLIACHQTGRIARLIELSEHYVDVSVLRYIELFGDSDIRLNGKKVTREIFS